MKNLFIFLLLASPVFAQSNIESYEWSNKVVFNAVDMSGTAADSSAWIYIGGMHYFGAYFTLSHDSTFWVKSIISDSLGFDIDYELWHGYTNPTTSSSGFRPKSTLTQTELASFTVADTAWVNTYQSLHTISTPISPGTWIRFISNKDAKNVLTKSYYLTMLLWRQP